MRSVFKSMPKEGLHTVAEFAGRPVAVRLVIDHRARRIGLRIDAARREAVAISPSSRAAPATLEFAAERAAWITQQLQRLPDPAPLKPGAVIPFLGMDHLLESAQGHGLVRRELVPSPRLIIPADDAALFAPRLARFLKAEARERLGEAVDRHAATLSVRPSSLTVRDTKSRWGSCSAARALSFSWRVILAPPAVLDYLAAHEVAHILEMNHSPRFWSHVERCCPDWRVHRGWLKRNGAELHAVGGCA